ncbi:MAG: hypothetical protein OEZ36_03815, partial [Spirochaetota bacterium]|nr:hypothetical protein [Spirochaetota bacterium]
MPVEKQMSQGQTLRGINDILSEAHGFRGVLLFEQFCNLAAVSDNCDICAKDKVYLNATIDRSFLSMLNKVSTASIGEFHEATNNIPITYNGNESATINFKDIVALYAMPSGDPEQADLDDVDIDEADDIVGDSGKTVREIIAENYKCKD